MKKRDEVEEQKCKEFMETQREMFTLKLANAEERAQNNDSIMKMLMQQQKDQLESMNKMFEKMQPPPPPESKILYNTWPWMVFYLNITLTIYTYIQNRI